MKEMVTIIMPFYNTEPCLFKKAVNSVIDQSFRDFELIIVDDGSKEEYAHLADEVAELDERIIVYHIKNGGVSGARNYGIEKAGGKFISFVDSDDFLSPYYLENLISVYKKTSSPYIKGCAVRVNGSDAEISSSCSCSFKVVDTATAVDDISFIKHPYPGMEITAVWGNLYTRDIISDTRFRTDVTIGEDYIFNLEIIRKLDSVTYSEAADYAYYINSSGAMIGGYSKAKVKSISGFKEYISDNLDCKYMGEITNRLVNIAIVILIMIPIDKEHKVESKEVIDFIKKYRSSVLRSRKTRKKVRLALLLSYLGFGLMERIYKAFAC